MLIKMKATQSFSNLSNVFTGYPKRNISSTEDIQTQSSRKIKEQSLECKFCQYIGPRLIRLQHHVKAKHQGLILKCKDCTFQSTESSNLQKHIDKIHKGIRHTCEYCSKIFVGKYQLKKHRKNKHTSPNNRLKVRCEECTNEYFTKGGLSTHYKSTHLGIIHLCSECNYKGSSKQKLNYHIQKHHRIQTIFSCVKCPYSCKSKKSLRVHGESKHSTVHVKCHQCPYTSSRSEYLRKHIKLHSGNMLKCDQCDFVTNTKDKLGNHIKDKHLSEKHFCLKCEYVTNSKRKLSDHKRHQHTEKITYSCDQCSYVTKQKRDMNIHKLNKHEGIVWPCKMCPFKAAQPGILSDHNKLIHFVNHQMKHKCDYCNKTFTKKFTLTLHIRLHTGEKPNSCEFCSTTFRASITRKHRLGLCSQLNDMIVCYICKEEVQTNKNRKMHLIKFHYEKLLKCPYCKTVFTTYKNMKRHIDITCRKIFTNRTTSEKENNRNDKHLRIKSNNPNRGCLCYICKTNVQGKENLKKHFINSHNEKWLTCPYCETSFTRYDTKTKHIKMSCKKYARSNEEKTEHISSKKTLGIFLCYICKLKVKGKETLNMHLNNSHNEKLLTCPHCGTSFTRYDTKTRHMRNICNEYLRKLQLLEEANDRKELITTKEIKPMLKEAEEKSKIEKLGMAITKCHTSVRSEDHVKEETTLQTYKDLATNFSFVENNQIDTAFQSNSGKTVISKCKTCAYASDNVDFIRLHMISHDVHGSKIFEKLPMNFKNRKFTSKEEFQEELENFLASTDLNSLNII